MLLLLHFPYLFHTIPYHFIASIDTKHQLVFCRTATVKYYFVHVVSNTHSLAEAETGALLCVSFPCRGEWRQQNEVVVSVVVVVVHTVFRTLQSIVTVYGGGGGGGQIRWLALPPIYLLP